MDYIPFCRRFYAATGIPLNLLYKGKAVYSSLGELLSFMPQDQWPQYPPTKNPEFSAVNPDLEYGHVQIEGSGYDLFLGPVFTSAVTEELVHAFFRDSHTPPDLMEAVSEQLYSMPISSHPQFIRYLIFLHLCLNHKEITEEHFYAEDPKEAAGRETRAVHTSVEVKESEVYRNTYPIEAELYHRIMEGNTERLKQFLYNTEELTEKGKTAKSPLRHTKNAFIALTAKVGVLSAIPGGMDPEHVYQLTDLYMQECEQMQTIEEIHRLKYIMLMDFCERCRNAKLPQSVSPEISRCMSYIENHTNVPIGVDDVAREVNRSSSYLMRRFKAELRMSIGEYITACRLREACDLLLYTDSSLSEISAYLCYSSQSYFQNVFKKHYGMTPLQYRKTRGQVS